MYQDVDHGLGRVRVEQMRMEVEHNRLEACLAKAARSNEDSVNRRDRFARGVALVMALFR